MSEQEEQLLEVEDEEQKTSSSSNSVKRNAIIIIVSVSLFVFALMYFLVIRKTATQTEPEADVTVSVKTAKAERKPIAKEVSVVGTIFPREQATLSASIGAQIKQMRVLKNAVVRKGDVIATLDSRDLQAQRAEATAALQEARLNLRGLTNSTIPQGDAQAEKELRDARLLFGAELVEVLHGAYEQVGEIRCARHRPVERAEVGHDRLISRRLCGFGVLLDLQGQIDERDDHRDGAHELTDATKLSD